MGTGGRAVTVGLAAVLAALLVGCAGGSAAPGPASSASSAAHDLPSRLTSPGGGLIGAIDQARLVPACENVRLAATALEGGLRTGAAQAMAGARATLRQPPAVPGAAALARREASVQRRSGLAAGIAVVQRLCH